MTSIADIVDHRHIAICCGTGGVGKTTTAATLAIEGDAMESSGQERKSGSWSKGVAKR